MIKEPHPHTLPCMKAKVRQVIAIMKEKAPIKSIFSFILGIGGIEDRAMKSPKIAIGILIRKIKRQLKYSVNSPPTKGPTVTARDPAEEMVPITLPLRFSGKQSICNGEAEEMSRAADIP